MLLVLKVGTAVRAATLEQHQHVLPLNWERRREKLENRKRKQVFFLKK